MEGLIVERAIRVYDNMERLLTTSVERDGAEPVLLCSNTHHQRDGSFDGVLR